LPGGKEKRKEDRSHPHLETKKTRRGKGAVVLSFSTAKKRGTEGFQKEEKYNGGGNKNHIKRKKPPKAIFIPGGKEEKMGFFGRITF